MARFLILIFTLVFFSAPAFSSNGLGPLDLLGLQKKLVELKKMAGKVSSIDVELSQVDLSRSRESLSSFFSKKYLENLTGQSIEEFSVKSDALGFDSYDLLMKTLRENLPKFCSRFQAQTGASEEQCLQILEETFSALKHMELPIILITSKVKKGLFSTRGKLTVVVSSAILPKWHALVHLELE